MSLQDKFIKYLETQVVADDFKSKELRQNIAKELADIAEADTKKQLEEHEEAVRELNKENNRLAVKNIMDGIADSTDVEKEIWKLYQFLAIKHSFCGKVPEDDRDKFYETVKNVITIKHLSNLIASDIQSQWKVIAKGRVKSAEFGFPNRLTINLDSFPTKIDTTLIEVNRKYEIAVRVIDE